MQSTPKEPRFKLTTKQNEALIYLQDKSTTELFFGGGAGGGKSYLGCAWLIANALSCKGTRWVMARAELKSLKQSTLLTFFGLCSHCGLVRDKDFTYNAMDGVIRFHKSKSEIYLRELKLNPSDPEFDKLGSTEYTGAFIDEGSQISFKGYNVLTSRLRYRLEQYNLVPKLLIASNPTKNFLHYEFYKPWKAGTLKPYRKLIQALVNDNENISPQYIEQLRRLPKFDQERLLRGNWDYEDDPTKLFEFDSLTDIFSRPGKRTPERYLISDIARFGKDKTTISIWEGLHVLEVQVYSGLGTDQTELKIEEKRAQYNIARSHTCVDEDGIGGGVVDHLKGIYGFVNNSRAIEVLGKPSNYANLKSQCYFYLAEAVMRGEIGCYTQIDPKIRQIIIEDLEQVKRDHPDEDRPLAVIPKDEMKEKLGRSPDLGDTFAMRMVFEIKKPHKTALAGWETEPHLSHLDRQQVTFQEFFNQR